MPTGSSGNSPVDREGLISELNAIAETYDPGDPSVQFDFWLKRLQAEAIRPWLSGRHLLELGCATGELTSLMAPLADSYDVVEASPRNIEVARRTRP